MSDAVTLPLRAENNPKFYSRFLWLGLGALGFGIFCLYEWQVNYPNMKERGQGLLAVAKESLSEQERNELAAGGHGESGYYEHLIAELSENEEFKAAWDAKVAAEGWPANPPDLFVTDAKILTQLPMAIGSLLLGAHFLFTVYRTRGRWFQLDENGITSRWGESFSLDQITEIEKAQWRKKGIARVRYQDAKGRLKTFVVDNYKYHRKTTERILWHIENVVGFDKLVGGKPGPDPDAPKVEPPTPPVAASEVKE